MKLQDTIAGVHPTQEVEERRRRFDAMLREAEAEADRDGTFTIEEVLAEADAIIDACERRRAVATGPP